MSGCGSPSSDDPEPAGPAHGAQLEGAVVDGSTDKGSGSTTLRVVGLLAAIAGGAGALIGGLAAAGYIDGAGGTSGPTTEITTTPPTSPPTTPPTTPPPPARGTISVFYRTEGTPTCVLTPEITIGDRTAQPSDFTPAITDVLLGRQDYSISGIIECVDDFGFASWCTIDGSGQIDVADGRSFFVVWNLPSVEFGVCNMWLSDV